MELEVDQLEQLDNPTRVGSLVRYIQDRMAEQERDRPSAELARFG